MLKPAAGLRLRKEHFGGIAFNAENGISADLDRAAFRMLATVVKGGAVQEEDLLENLSLPDKKGNNRTAARSVLDELVELGLLLKHNGPHLQAAVTPIWHHPVDPGKMKPIQGCLTAPETIHWAVTYDCRSRCPDCYTRRHRESEGEEMNAAEALRAVAALADWGVFQLTIGGGEPFLRPDLPDLASAAARRGMVVHVTTGLGELPEKEVERLSSSVEVLQLGIDEHKLLKEPEKMMDSLGRSLEMAAGAGMKTGANLKVSETTLTNFKFILDQLAGCGFDSITLLRYKPPPSYERWLAENPSPESVRALELFLEEARADYSHIAFRVDCAFGFLFRHLEGPGARRRGLRGCVAAQRIAALDPQGNLLPCSQLYAPRFHAGNILEEEPGLIWRQSPVLKKYRSFRNKSRFKDSQCGICKAAAHCGGCRVFADDALGADPFCPEPLWPPLNVLGKRGRKVELAEYMRIKGCISVEEYMERYGVGCKTAVRELRSSFLQKIEFESKGKMKADCYSVPGYGIVETIQDMIGYTSGGLPFATAEEINSWLDEAEPARKYKGYPRWLIEESAEGRKEDENY